MVRDDHEWWLTSILEVLRKKLNIIRELYFDHKKKKNVSAMRTRVSDVVIVTATVLRSVCECASATACGRYNKRQPRGNRAANERPTNRTYITNMYTNERRGDQEYQR